MAFEGITQEQREQARLKAQESIRRKKESSISWKHDWLDASLWEFLRKKTKIRAAPSYIHCSETKYIRRTLKQLEKDRAWWQENFFPKYEDFAKNNPLVPMCALQGLMIEAARPDLVRKFKGDE